MNTWLILYLFIMNTAAFAVFAVDKAQAVREKWRVSERTLWLLAVLGGSLGALAGMRVFRHKTRKARFKAGIPLILAVQCVVVYGVSLYS